jgi:hypothetical protein
MQPQVRSATADCRFLSITATIRIFCDRNNITAGSLHPQDLFRPAELYSFGKDDCWHCWPTLRKVTVIQPARLLRRHRGLAKGLGYLADFTSFRQFRRVAESGAHAALSPGKRLIF